MNKLLKFILERKSFLLFLFLEFIAFTMIIRSNLYLNYRNNHALTEISGRYNNRIHKITEYFELKNINRSLQKENARLKNEFIHQINDTIDLTTWKNFKVIPATIITNQFQFSNNHIIIDKGKNDGIHPGMGVIGTKGIIGTVTKTSPHYAAVLSILNNKTAISVKTKYSNHFGFLKWEGKSPKILRVEDIPLDAKLNISDTLVTSGNSNIFPKGIPVGIITDIKKLKGSKNFEVKIRPIEDLTDLSVAYVLRNKYQKEFLQLKDSLNEN